MMNAIRASTTRRASPSEFDFLPVVAIGFMLIFAAVSGAGLALFGGELGVLLIGALGAIGFLVAPRAAAWAIFMGGVVVAGLVQLYLPGLQSVRWLFAVMSIAIGVISAVKWLANTKPSVASTEGTTPLALFLLLFVIAALTAALGSGSGAMNNVVGLKNYFQMWGLLFAFAWLGYKPTEVRRFMLALGLLASIQLPFALHQFFVLVPIRSGAAYAAKNLVAVDIVAGTFGGDMNGGGRSADLAVLAAIGITLFFAQWKLGFRKLGSTLLFSALAFAPMLFNEAKLALVLLPIGLLLLFRNAIMRRPFAWTLGASVLASCLIAIVFVYSTLPGADSQRSASMSDFVSTAMEMNVGEKGYGSAVLNRSTVYRFWWQSHISKGDIQHAVLGHGPGFSSSSSIGRGDIAGSAKYRGYAIGLTGISSLLWDTGILGTFALLAALFAAYRLGGRLVRKWQGTIHEPVTLAAQIAVALIAISLFHNDYVSFDIGFQTMLAVVLGYIFAMAKASPTSGS